MSGQSGGLYTAPTVTFLAFILLFLTCISVPFAQEIRFFTLVDRLTGGSIRFGLWGYCLSKSIDDYPQCSLPKIGWTFQNIRTLVGLDDSISPISTGILFIHPIAAICVFIVFVVSIALILRSSSQHKSPTKSRRKSSHDYLLPTLIVLAAMITTIALVVDIFFIVNIKRRVKEATLPAKNMKAYTGAIIWLTAFAALILWLATIMLSVMGKDKSRDERFTEENASAYDSDVSGRRRDTPAQSIRSSGSQQPSEYSMHSRTVSVSRGDDEDWRADSISTRRSQLSTSRQGSRGSYDADDRYDSAEDPPQKEKSHGFLATCLPCLKRRKDKDMDDREDDIELGEMRDSDTRLDSDSMRSSVEDYQSRIDRSSGVFDEERGISSVKDVSSLDRHSEDPAEEEKSHGFLAACLPCLKRRKDKDMDDREEDIELSEMHDSDIRVDTDSLRTSVEDLQSRTIKSSDVFTEEIGRSSVQDASDLNRQSQYSGTLSDRGVSDSDGSQYSPPRTPSPSYIDRDRSEGSYASSRQQPSASLSYRKSSSVRSMSTLRTSHGAYSDDDTMIENESSLISNKGSLTNYPSGSGASFRSDKGSVGNEFEGTPVSTPFSDGARSMVSYVGETPPISGAVDSVVSNDPLETPLSSPVSSRHESYVSERPMSSSYRSGPPSTYPASAGEQGYESGQGWTSARISDRSPEYSESMGELSSPPGSRGLSSEGYNEESQPSFASNASYESPISHESLQTPLSSPVSGNGESYVSERPMSSSYRSGPLSTYPASAGEEDYESGQGFTSTRISDRSPEYPESMGEFSSRPRSSALPSERYESEPMPSSPLSDRVSSPAMYESGQPASSVYGDDASREIGQSPLPSDNEEYDSNIASFSRPPSETGYPEEFQSGQSVPSTVYSTGQGEDDGNFERALSDRPSSVIHSSLPGLSSERDPSSPAPTDYDGLEFEPEPETPPSSRNDTGLDYEGEQMSPLTSQHDMSMGHEDEYPPSTWRSSHNSDPLSPYSDSNLTYVSGSAADSQGSGAERGRDSEDFIDSRSEQMSDMVGNDSYMSEPPGSSLASNKGSLTYVPSENGTSFRSDLGSTDHEFEGTPLPTAFSDGSRSMASYEGETPPISDAVGSVVSNDPLETPLSSPVSDRSEGYVSERPMSSSYRSGPLSTYPASAGEQDYESGQGFTSTRMSDRSLEHTGSMGEFSSPPLSTRLPSEGYDQEEHPSFASDTVYESEPIPSSPLYDRVSSPAMYESGQPASSVYGDDFSREIGQSPLPSDNEEYDSNIASFSRPLSDTGSPEDFQSGQSVPSTVYSTGQGEDDGDFERALSDRPSSVIQSSLPGLSSERDPSSPAPTDYDGLDFEPEPETPHSGGSDPGFDYEGEQVSPLTSQHDMSMGHEDEYPPSTWRSSHNSDPLSPYSDSNLTYESGSAADSRGSGIEYSAERGGDSEDFIDSRSEQMTDMAGNDSYMSEPPGSSLASNEGQLTNYPSGNGTSFRSDLGSADHEFEGTPLSTAFSDGSRSMAGYEGETPPISGAVGSMLSNDPLETPLFSPVSGNGESYVSERPMSSSYRSGPLSSYPASAGEQGYESGQGWTSAQMSNRSPDYSESMGEFSSPPGSRGLSSEGYDQESHPSFASGVSYESDPVQPSQLSDRVGSLEIYESGQPVSSVYEDDASREIGQSPLLSDNEEYDSNIASFSRSLSDTGSPEDYRSGQSVPSTVYSTGEGEGESDGDFERALSDRPSSVIQSSLPGLSSEPDSLPPLSPASTDYDGLEFEPEPETPHSGESDPGFDYEGDQVSHLTSQHDMSMGHEDEYPPSTWRSSHNSDPLSPYSDSNLTYESGSAADSRGSGLEYSAERGGDSEDFIGSRSEQMSDMAGNDSYMSEPLGSPLASNEGQLTNYPSGNGTSFRSDLGSADHEFEGTPLSTAFSDGSRSMASYEGETLPISGAVGSVVSNDPLETPLSSPVSSRHESYVSERAISSSYRSGPFSSYPASSGEQDYEPEQGWTSAQISDRSPDYSESMGEFSSPRGSRGLSSEGYDQESYPSFSSGALYESDPVQSSPLSDRVSSLAMYESGQPASSVYGDDSSREIGQTPLLSDNEEYDSNIASSSRPLSDTARSLEDYRSGQSVPSTVYPTEESDGDFERATSERQSSVIQSELEPETPPSSGRDSGLDFEGEQGSPLTSLPDMSTDHESDYPLSSWGSGYGSESLLPSSPDAEYSESNLSYEPSSVVDSRGSGTEYSAERGDSDDLICSRSEQISDMGGNDSGMSGMSTNPEGEHPLSSWGSGSGSESLSPSSPDVEYSESNLSYESSPATDSRGSGMEYSADRGGDSDDLIGSRSEQISDIAGNDSGMSDMSTDHEVEHPLSSWGSGHDSESLSPSSPDVEYSESKLSYESSLGTDSRGSGMEYSAEREGGSDNLIGSRSEQTSDRAGNDSYISELPESSLASNEAQITKYPSGSGTSDMSTDHEGEHPLSSWGSGYGSESLLPSSPDVEFSESNLSYESSLATDSRGFDTEHSAEREGGSDDLIDSRSEQMSDMVGNDSYMSEPPESSLASSKGPFTDYPSGSGTSFQSDLGSIGETTSSGVVGSVVSQESSQTPISSPVSSRRESYVSERQTSSSYRSGPLSSYPASAGEQDYESGKACTSAQISDRSPEYSESMGELSSPPHSTRLPSEGYDQDVHPSFASGVSYESSPAQSSQLSDRVSSLAMYESGQPISSVYRDDSSQEIGQTPLLSDNEEYDSNIASVSRPFSDTARSLEDYRSGQSVPSAVYPTDESNGDFEQTTSDRPSSVLQNSNPRFSSERNSLSPAFTDDMLTGHEGENPPSSWGSGYESLSPSSLGPQYSELSLSYEPNSATDSRSSGMDYITERGGDSEDFLGSRSEQISGMAGNDSYMSGLPESSLASSKGPFTDYPSGSGTSIRSDLGSAGNEFEGVSTRFSDGSRSMESYVGETTLSGEVGSVVSQESLQTPFSSSVSSRRESYVSERPMSSSYRSGPLSSYTASAGERDYESGRGWTSAQISDRSPEYQESVEKNSSRPYSSRIPSGRYESEPMSSSPLSDRMSSPAMYESGQSASSVYRDDSSQEIGQSPLLSDNEEYDSNIVSVSRPLSDTAGSLEDYRSGQSVPSTVYPTDESDGDFERTTSERQSSVIQSDLEPETPASSGRDSGLDYEEQQVSPLTSHPDMSTGHEDEYPPSTWRSDYESEPFSPSPLDAEYSGSNLSYEPRTSTDNRGSGMEYSAERGEDSGGFTGSRSERMSDMADNDSYMSEPPESSLVSNEGQLTNYPTGSGASFRSDLGSAGNEFEGTPVSTRFSDGSRSMESYVGETTPSGAVGSVVSQESSQTLFSSSVSDRRESYVSERPMSSSYRSGSLSTYPASGGERDYESGQGWTSAQTSDRSPGYYASVRGSSSAPLSSRLPSDGYDQELHSSYVSNASYGSGVSHDSMQTPLSSSVSDRRESYVSERPMSSNYRSGRLSTYPASGGEQDYESEQGWTSAQTSDRSPGYYESVRGSSSAPLSSRLPSDGYDQELHSSYVSNASYGSGVSHDSLQTRFSSSVSDRRESYVSELVVSSSYRSGRLSTYPTSAGERDYDSGQGWTSAQTSDRSPEYHESVGEISSRPRSSALPSERYESAQPVSSAYQDDSSQEIGQSPLLSNNEGYDSNIASVSRPLSDTAGSREDYRSGQSAPSTIYPTDDSDSEDYIGSRSEQMSNMAGNDSYMSEPRESSLVSNEGQLTNYPSGSGASFRSDLGSTGNEFESTPLSPPSSHGSRSVESYVSETRPSGVVDSVVSRESLQTPFSSVSGRRENYVSERPMSSSYRSGRLSTYPASGGERDYESGQGWTSAQTSDRSPGYYASVRGSSSAPLSSRLPSDGYDQELHSSYVSNASYGSSVSHDSMQTPLSSSVSDRRESYVSERPMSSNYRSGRLSTYPASGGEQDYESEQGWTSAQTSDRSPGYYESVRGSSSAPLSSRLPSDGYDQELHSSYVSNASYGSSVSHDSMQTPLSSSVSDRRESYVSERPMSSNYRSGRLSTYPASGGEQDYESEQGWTSAQISDRSPGYYASVRGSSSPPRSSRLRSEGYDQEKHPSFASGGTYESEPIPSSLLSDGMNSPAMYESGQPASSVYRDDSSQEIGQSPLLSDNERYDSNIASVSRQLSDTARSLEDYRSRQSMHSTVYPTDDSDNENERASSNHPSSVIQSSLPGSDLERGSLSPASMYDDSGENEPEPATPSSIRSDTVLNYEGEQVSPLTSRPDTSTGHEDEYPPSTWRSNYESEPLSPLSLDPQYSDSLAYEPRPATDSRGSGMDYIAERGEDPEHFIGSRPEQMSDMAGNDSYMSGLPESSLASSKGPFTDYPSGSGTSFRSDLGSAGNEFEGTPVSTRFSDGSRSMASYVGEITPIPSSSGAVESVVSNDPLETRLFSPVSDGGESYVSGPRVSSSYRSGRLSTYPASADEQDYESEQGWTSAQISDRSPEYYESVRGSSSAPLSSRLPSDGYDQELHSSYVSNASYGSGVSHDSLQTRFSSSVSDRRESYVSELAVSSIYRSEPLLASPTSAGEREYESGRGWPSAQISDRSPEYHDSVGEFSSPPRSRRLSSEGYDQGSYPSFASDTLYESGPDQSSPLFDRVSSLAMYESGQPASSVHQDDSSEILGPTPLMSDNEEYDSKISSSSRLLSKISGSPENYGSVQSLPSTVYLSDGDYERAPSDRPSSVIQDSLISSTLEQDYLSPASTDNDNLEFEPEPATTPASDTVLNYEGEQMSPLTSLSDMSTGRDDEHPLGSRYDSEPLWSSSLDPQKTVSNLSYEFSPATDNRDSALDYSTEREGDSKHSVGSRSGQTSDTEEIPRICEYCGAYIYA